MRLSLLGDRRFGAWPLKYLVRLTSTTLGTITVRVVPVAVTLFFALMLPGIYPALPQAPDSAGSDIKTRVAIRSCGHLEEPTAPASSKRKKHIITREETRYTPACLEVQAPPLDVQERLQQFVRRQKWAIFDEEISETLWSFGLPLTKDELFAYANPPAGTDRIRWESGRTVLLVRTLPLSEGYSRTTVSAQFRGFGESNDTFATQRAFWEWNSSGKLEASFTEELRIRFGTGN